MISTLRAGTALGVGRIGWVLAAVCMAVCPAARAQLLAGCGSQPDAGQTHGWVVLPGLDDAFSLVHLPPRGADLADGITGAPAGSARIVAQLTRLPQAMAAIDGRVYLVFAPTEPDPDAPPGSAHPEREVLSMAAYPTGLAGLWSYVPSGRLRVHRALDRPGTLRGLAPSPAGPMALLEPDGGGLLLAVLNTGAWDELALPEPVRSSSRHARLIDWAGQPAVLIARGDFVEVWRGTATRTWPDPAGPATPTQADGPGSTPPGQPDALDPVDAPIQPVRPSIEITWTRQPTSVPASVLSQDDGLIVAMLDTLIVSSRDGSDLVLTEHDGSKSLVLARIAGVGERFAAAPLRDADRLALVWTDPGDEPSVLHTRLVELSAATGRTIFRGDANFTGPISPGEFRVLALVMVGLTMLVLVYLLRGGPDDGAVELPEGWALAEPGRRLAGAMIDLLVAASITSWLLGVSLLGALTVDPLGSAGLASWGLGVTLVAGMVLATACEAIWSRTLGKWLVGARVTLQGPRVRRPGVWAALVRNGCKWLVPPLAVLGLWDPSGRHRGDVLASTLVVVPIDESDEPVPADPVGNDPA